MKKENKKLAQERRAKERRKAANRKLALRILGIVIAIAIIAGLVVLIIKSSDSSDSTDDATTESLVEATTEAAISDTTEADTTTLDTTEGLVAEDGDTVNIAYTGYLDGEAFDGGSSDSYDLTLGSNTFIDGFEDGVVGHSVGETFDIDLTFPDDYWNEEMAGQAVTFTVTLNGIYTD